ncbi:MAG: hypothetical protein R3268_11560 [Acidiferrobacterales bacterium]|nr:hypothetical protein [Acidiferrobacterales bacterium]
MSPPILVHAQDALPDKFKIDVGVFFVTEIDTTVSITPTGAAAGVGALVEFEDVFGLGNSERVPRIDGYYRFGKRSRVDFTYFKIDRDGTVVTPFDIDFGDAFFPAGTAVTSFFDEEVIKASYGLSFYNVPKAELGISAGLFVSDISVGVSTVPGGASDKGTVTAPLPVIGAYFRYEMPKRWRFVGKVDFFYLEFDDFEGNLIDLRLNVEHQTWKNVGFGFGLNAIGTNLEVDDRDFRGEFDSTLQGVQAYVFTAFGKARYQQ